MRVRGLKCPRCEAKYPSDYFAKLCIICAPEVSVGLAVEYVNERYKLSRSSFDKGPRSIWRYAHSLPVAEAESVSLGEGMTPLVEMKNIGSEIDLPHLYAKCEFSNPTGSFKDRLASVAISSARALFDAKVIASSSTGNAGAAVAAYACKAGMPCVIFTLEGAAGPMVAQMQAFGAIVVTVQTKADRWKLLSEGVEKYNWFPTSPFFGPPVGSNPYGIEGYKSLAYELAESFDWLVPDWIVLPICYGDALFGMWRGFNELIDAGLVGKMPRFVAAEIYGSLTAAIADGSDIVPFVDKNYDTAATSISAQQSTYQALATLRKTSGLPVTVSEDELLNCGTLLSSREGLFVEPAAAAALAATIQLRRNGTISHSDSVVCVLTAGGLKAPTFQTQAASKPIGGVGSVTAVVDAVRSQRRIDLQTGSRLSQ
jgi:threonine synthase